MVASARVAYLARRTADYGVRTGPVSVDLALKATYPPIEAIEFVEDYKHLGARQGGYNEDHEFYSWRSPI